MEMELNIIETRKFMKDNFKKDFNLGMELNITKKMKN